MKTLKRFFNAAMTGGLSVSLLCLPVTSTFSSTPGSSIATSSRQPPNIIFIMTDDHTRQAMSAYGSKLIQTPNLDRIANEGIKFNRSFVTNSICAPSRAVALTGKYSHVNGLRDNRDTFDGSQQTFPKLLQKAGYYTAIIGKWHLKSKPTGFDSWKVLPGQGDYYNPEFIEPTGRVRHKGYVTTLITDMALDTIRQRDKKKPFALLYFHKAPHRNWMPDLKDLSLYKNKTFPVPKTFFDNYETRTSAAKAQDMRIEDMFYSMDMKLHLPPGVKEPNTGGNKKFNAIANWTRTYHSMTKEQQAAWDAAYDEENNAFLKANLSGKELALWKYQRYIKDYLRTIKSVDDNVGRLLNFLDQQGLSENTVVVYTSDQGFYLGEHGWFDKRFMYEESMSMPLAVRYPGVIPAGMESDELVLNLDIAPTLLDFAGVDIPRDMQGESLQQLIKKPTKGETSVPWRSSVYYHYYEYPHGWHSVHRHRGVRTKTHKLIHFYDNNEWELYDLEKDPNELNNLYGQPGSKALQNDMKKALASLRQQYHDSED